MTESEQFETFMRSYQNMVFTTAARLLGNESDAADVSQEAFMRAFNHFPELRDNPRAGGWLKTVTRNLCLNHLERYRARWSFFSELTSDESGEGFERNLPAPEASSQPMDDAHRRQLLEAALQKLPPAQRVPLVLYHFEEMSYEDIARQLGVSLSKVKTDIHRGRETLRRKLTLRPAGEWGSGGESAAASFIEPLQQSALG
jgi:RNA polymerase sigma-70 factor (ECF subfamily)